VLILCSIEGANQPLFLDLTLFKNLAFLYLNLFLLVLLFCLLVDNKSTILFLSSNSALNNSCFSFVTDNPINLLPASTPNTASCFVSPVEYNNCIVNGVLLTTLALFCFNSFLALLGIRH